MIQETIAYQDDTTNITHSFQPSQKKNIFRNILKIKIRRKKYQLEECNNKCSNSSLCSDTFNLEEDDQNPQLKITKSSTSVSSSSETVLPDAIESQPNFSIKPESTANSWSKSVSLFSHFPWNNTLKHKSSSTSEASTTNTTNTTNSSILNRQENLVDSTKKKKLFIFPKRKPILWNNKNNYSNSTINSSIESSNDERNDSAYETETDCSKKNEKKGKKKKIRRTKMKTLSSKDKEYIEIQKSFKNGLPNKDILGIIRLQMPTKLVEAHEQFKREVAQTIDLPESRICHRMFHGTKTSRMCKPQHFVNNKYAIFCRFGCGVCGIAQEGNRTKYSRYTQRMWFANNSATSLSYCSSNAVKAMFVVEVVSVSPNSILIVEKDEATIPKYLIIFK